MSQRNRKKDRERAFRRWHKRFERSGDKAMTTLALTLHSAFLAGWKAGQTTCNKHWRESMPPEVLDEQQWAHFMHAMENPKPPTRSMLDAIALHKSLVASKLSLNPKVNQEKK